MACAIIDCANETARHDQRTKGANFRSDIPNFFLNVNQTPALITIKRPHTAGQISSTLLYKFSAIIAINR